MNILMFCFEYPPVGGGGGVGAQQYAEAWVTQNHRVCVITSRALNLPSCEIKNGVEIKRVWIFGRKDRATSTVLSMLCYNLFGLFYVFSHGNLMRQFDVVNTHFSIPSGPLATIAVKVFDLPHVLTIIGGDIFDPSKKSSPHRSWFMRLVNRWVIDSADHVVAISSDTKKRAEAYYKIHNTIEVINYGFKPNYARESGPSGSHDTDSKEFRLISIGRLIKRKGFDYAIRALKFLPDEVVLHLVGDGPLETDLRKLANDEGVSARVHLHGFQTREQINALLRRSHCFVLSSLHEGLGIVVQEAMDAGLPIVATNDGGQVDLVNHLRNGVLVSPEDAKGLANGIRTIYDNPTLAETIRQNNLNDIKRLHIDCNSQLYLDVFKDAMEKIKPLVFQ